MPNVKNDIVACNNNDQEALYYAVAFHRVDKSSIPFSIDLLESELQQPDVMVWIDLQDSGTVELNRLLQRLRADNRLIAHFDETEILPRIVEHQDSLGFCVYEIANPEHHLDTSHGLKSLQVHRLLLIIGSNFVLTFHRTPLDVIEHVKDNCVDCFRLWGKTQGFIMFLVLQRCLYDYANLNLANDNYLDHLEEDLIKGDRDALSQGIAVASSNILTLKKLTASLHIVLMMLGTKRSVFVSDEARRSYLEMNENVMSVRAAINSSCDLLNGVIASQHAQATARTGDITRVLTVVSTIMLPLSLVTGIYGMNFYNMPELMLLDGYYWVLSGMLILTITQVSVFWKLGWLGKRKIISIK